MNKIIDVIKDRARADVKTIVLPEPEDDRILKAAAEVVVEKTANLIILASREELDESAKRLGINLDGVKAIDPLNCDKFDEYANLLFELRKAKGMTLESAKEQLSTNKLIFGIMMVKAGDADGMVGGASHTTADVLRPSLQILKTAPGVEYVSGFFIMDIPDCEYGYNGTFLMADCGLNQDPTPEILAAVAKCSDKSFRDLVGAQPIIAMLSYSTKGSAKKHPLVDRVVDATKLAHEKYPELLVDGELQADAAIVPEVAKIKAPDSPVAGKANVLIYPNLDCGNISHKLIQRLAKAEAYGPMLQGIAKPVNDLSRGCLAEDIVGIIAVTAVQAQIV